MERKQKAIIGRDGLVVGWGKTESTEKSNVLQQALMPVVDHIDCLESNVDFYGPYLSKTNCCAGLRNGSLQ